MRRENKRYLYFIFLMCTLCTSVQAQSLNTHRMDFIGLKLDTVNEFNKINVSNLKTGAWVQATDGIITKYSEYSDGMLHGYSIQVDKKGNYLIGYYKYNRPLFFWDLQVYNESQFLITERSKKIIVQRDSLHKIFGLNQNGEILNGYVEEHSYEQEQDSILYYHFFSKGEYLNGKREGVWERTIITDYKSKETYFTTYKNGLKNGMEYVFRYGKLYSSAMYKSGHKIGNELFYKNGKVYVIVEYKPNGTVIEHRKR